MPFGVVNNLQDILFEHRANIREDIYVELMDSLQGANHEMEQAEAIVEMEYIYVKPSDITETGQYAEPGLDFHCKLHLRSKIVSMSMSDYSKYSKQIDNKGVAPCFMSKYHKRYRRRVGIDTSDYRNDNYDEDEDDEDVYEEGFLNLCTDNIMIMKIKILKNPTNSILQKKTSEASVQTREEEVAIGEVVIDGITIRQDDIPPVQVIESSDDEQDLCPDCRDEATTDPMIRDINNMLSEIDRVRRENNDEPEEYFIPYWGDER